MKGFGEPEDHALAEEAFDKALALDPYLIEARMNRSSFTCRAEKKRKRAGWLTSCAAKHPTMPACISCAAWWRVSMVITKRRCAVFERMARLNPAERVVDSYNRARLLNYQGKYDEALAQLDQGAAIEPDHPLIKTFRARTLYYRGEPVKAAEILEEVLEQHPQLDGIRPIYATFLSALGWHDDARAQLTDEVRKRPTRIMTWLIGWRRPMPWKANARRRSNGCGARLNWETKTNPGLSATRTGMGGATIRSIRRLSDSIRLRFRNTQR